MAFWNLLLGLVCYTVPARLKSLAKVPYGDTKLLWSVSCRDFSPTPRISFVLGVTILFFVARKC